MEAFWCRFLCENEQMFQIVWDLFERTYWKYCYSKEMLWTTFLLWIRKPWPFSRSAVALQDAHVTLSDLGSSLSGVGLLSHGPGWRDSIKCWWWEISFVAVYCENDITQVRKTWVDSGFLYDSDQLPLLERGAFQKHSSFRRKKPTCFVCDSTTAA